MNAYFAALALPDQIQAELATLVGDLAGVYWLESPNYHITLAYFGPLNDETAGDLGRALSQIKQKPLTLRLGTVRLNPESGEPRAIVVQVKQDDRLDALRQKVNRSAIEIGLERKRERYAPHVTLGRLSPNGRALDHPDYLAQFLAERATFHTEPFDLFSFGLYLSRKTSSGHQYEQTAEYDLI